MMAGSGTMPTGADGGPARHIPVLLSEVLEALSPKDGGLYLDGTFGAGGYTQAILEAADCYVIAIDRDADAIAAGESLESRYRGRLTLIEADFAELDEIAAARGIECFDGIVLDIGVSSMQLDTPGRGFSFTHDGPLDMRMARDGATAADVINSLKESDLARVIAFFGEERRAKAIARAIAKAREERPLTRTSELADLVVGVLGRRPDQAIHPATKTFQALRIYVNGELDALAGGLVAAERQLREGGRLVVVTFHSLEDRIVKRFFVERAAAPRQPSRHRPAKPEQALDPSFRLLTRRPLRPSPQEIAENARARSAQLRAGERTGAPAFPGDISSLGVPAPAGLAPI